MTCVQDILIVTMALMKARRRVKVMKRQKEMVGKEWNTVCSHGHAYDFLTMFPPNAINILLIRNSTF